MNRVQPSRPTASSPKPDGDSGTPARPAAAPQRPRPAGWAWTAFKPAFIGFLLALAVEGAAVVLRLDRGALEPALAGLFWVIAAITTLTGLARRLPAQNVAASAAIIGFCAVALGSLNALTGVPFGQRFYTDELGPQLPGGLPWVVPLIWIVFLVNSRGVARLIMRPWRKTNAYGYWVVGLTGLLSAVLDFGLQFFAGQLKHYWLWEVRADVGSGAVALGVNFLATAAIAVCITAFSTPWLINKQPIKQATDYHPIVIWLLINLLFTSAAVLVGAWGSAGLCVAAAMAATALAVRGARW